MLLYAQVPNYLSPCCLCSPQFAVAIQGERIQRRSPFGLIGKETASAAALCAAPLPDGHVLGSANRLPPRCTVLVCVFFFVCLIREQDRFSLKKGRSPIGLIGKETASAAALCATPMLDGHALGGANQLLPRCTVLVYVCLYLFS